ncbi:MAG: glycosyltransferase family 4 protein [bacterium]
MLYNLYYETGGVSTVVNTLLKELKKKDELKIYSISIVYGKRIIKYENDYSIILPAFFRKLPQIIRFLIETPLSLFLIKRIRPDIIHAHSINSLAIAGSLINIPKIFTIHGVFKDQINFRKSKFSLLDKINNKGIVNIEKFLINRYDNIISISPYTFEQIKKIRNSENDYKIYNVYNPIDTIFYNEHNIENNKDKKAKIFFGGRIWKLKGVKELVYAFYEIIKKGIDAELIIAGEAITESDKKYLSDINKFIIENNINDYVKFVGYLDKEQMIENINNSNVIVLYSYQESSPMIISEAIAMQKAVVVSNIPGIRHLVKNNINGFIVEKNDISGLSMSIYKIIANKELKNYFESNAINIARNFNAKTVAIQTMKIYQQMLERKK